MKPKLLIPVFLLLILSLACNLGTPQNEPPVQPTVIEQPTQQPEPTSPPPTQTPAPVTQPTAEVPSDPEPTEEVVLANKPFRLEEFENDIDMWSWFITSGREDKTDIYRDRGRIVFELLDEDIYAYLMYDEYYYEDVKISTLVENRGKNTNSVSLVCRYDKNIGWYEFNIGSDGLYNILRYDGTLEDGEYIFLANGGSNQIRTGQEFNEYTVSCEDDVLILWINGKETQSIKDRTLKEGLVGISASSYYVTPIIVEFEYVDISLP